MRQKLFLALGVILVFSLAACGIYSAKPEVYHTATPGEPSPSPTPTSQLAGGSQEKPPMDVPTGAVIVYRQSGGFAGLDEEWTLYADGRVTAKDGRQWQTSPEQVSELVERLKTLGFFEIEAVPISMIPCCDRFYYELTVISGAQANSAATYDGAPSTPASLSQAIQAVTDFLDRTQEGPG